MKRDVGEGGVWRRRYEERGDGGEVSEGGEEGM